jgi:hypothetical protein
MASKNEKSAAHELLEGHGMPYLPIKRLIFLSADIVMKRKQRHPE